MRFSRQFVLTALGLSLGSALWAAGPSSSEQTTTPQNVPPLMFSGGGAMASGSASGFASGSSNSSGGNGQTMSRAHAQVQIGGLPQTQATGSPGDAINGGMPANLINLNPNQLLNPAVLNQPGMMPAMNNPAMNNPVGANPAGTNTRAVAKINAGEDKITTGADEQYSTVIKVKPNGQITMIVVTMASMEVRRAQAPNIDELRKKDKLAYTEYLKYAEAE